MSNHSFHGYIAVERTVANLSEANWIKLIDAVRALDVHNGANQYLLQERGNLDRFELVIDEDNSIWYSNAYTWEARYAAGEIEFKNFKTALVELFEVEPQDVTFTTGTTTIRERLSCFATYFYNGKKRIRIGLFGAASDSELCSWNCSRIEHNGYIADNAEDWDGVA